MEGNRVPKNKFAPLVYQGKTPNVDLQRVRFLSLQGAQERDNPVFCFCCLKTLDCRVATAPRNDGLAK
jgi:hypothetical protein